MSARDAYYQKERVSTRNGAEWDVAFVRACVCVAADTRTDLQTDFLDGFRVGLLFNLRSYFVERIKTFMCILKSYVRGGAKVT